MVTSNHIDFGVADNDAVGARIGAATGVVVNNKDALNSSIALSVQQLVVANNILYSRSTTGLPVCMDMQANPLRFENNLYFGCPDTPVTSPSALSFDDLNDCTTYPASNGSQPVACGGNFTDASATSFFAGYAASDMKLLPAAPAQVRLGGLDASTALYGNVTMDAERKQRDCVSPGVCYSIGAYEQ